MGKDSFPTVASLRNTALRSSRASAGIMAQLAKHLHN